MTTAYLCVIKGKCDYNEGESGSSVMILI